MTIDINAQLKNRLQERAATFGGDAQTLANLLIADGLRVLEDDRNDPDALARDVAAMTSRTEEEKAAARARAIAVLQPRTAPPPGTNGMQLVYGQWPGDETDEQVQAALDKLS